LKRLLSLATGDVGGIKFGYRPHGLQVTNYVTHRAFTQNSAFRIEA
jgi:hypothetical protein